ncbi:uncharacterized protein EV420DRAFT_1742575 [Desarmillaria tabescens]|uniref:Uncharacterized protein n=1 Tax=Armillaria tabescens TaxID=1929756 RepID=A0AA39NR35_ARMTA|nr:uncharacterized protein EV420DRAFT_1742575 [Desarmillaria tabescens]KAK0470135.1 hypothetical protein EV420DRAFT_1742575 [Desarmillaria tabescens]
MMFSKPQATSALAHLFQSNTWFRSCSIVISVNLSKAPRLLKRMLPLDRKENSWKRRSDRCRALNVRSAVISVRLEPKKSHEIVREETSAFTSNSNLSHEASSAWDEWKRVAQDFERVKNGAQDARSRLAALPFGRKIVNTGLEYYTVHSAEIDPRFPLEGFTGRSRSAYVDCPRLGTARQKQFLGAWNIVRGLLCVALLWGNVGDDAVHDQGIPSLRVFTSRYTKIMEVLLNRLQEQSPSDLPAWIYITEEAVSGIIDRSSIGTPIYLMLRHLARTARTPVDHSHFLNSPGMASNFLDTYHKRQEEKREQFRRR